MDVQVQLTFGGQPSPDAGAVVFAALYADVGELTSKSFLWVGKSTIYL